MVNKAARALLCMQRQSWEQGVTLQAFLELGKEETVYALAKEAAYRAAPDGRPALVGASNGCTDPCAAGEGMLYALTKTGDAALRTACANLEAWALEKAPRNNDGLIYHLTDKPQFWVDSFYMLPPYLAAAGYPEEAMRQIRGYWNILWNSGSGLLHHIWDDGEKRFIREAYWGVGNGWAAAALARMIALLPARMKAEREELVGKAQGLIDTLLGYLRQDGKFHDVVDDPDTFLEVNLSQMLAYTIFRACKAGWAKEGWLEKAQQMRGAAHGQVDRFGLVQGVCGAPTFDKPGVAPEGQAFFLLMEAAASSITP